MYYKLQTVNRRASYLLAVLILTSLFFWGAQDPANWFVAPLNLILISFLAGTVVAQPFLQRLALKESLDLVENMSYEEIVAMEKRQKKR